ncbi:outer membrane protein assembly factor BamC [Massilia sp. S19_KUP03_FR1]|uniref:outer membrane protein assembly factor BamC n=1 Tax=Massilia sp. S19_KUP03_FR1 TaxID=3025503 RepID=UPI002FCD5C79
MTIRKTTTLVSPSATARVLALTTLAFSLGACSMLGIGSNKVDYKASKRTAPLDVPPDLTQLEKDGRYAVPDSRGIATASGMNKGGNQAAVAGPGAAEVIGPVSTDAVRVERSGNQKWLVVKRTPEQLWPEIKKFWEDSGFEIAQDSPTTGIMETAWNEDRSKIPQDFIRRTIGRVFDSAYSTGERDKFRTRLERLPDGSTEVWISHRGAEEVMVGATKESSTWTSRPNDPALESAFLSRLVSTLTGATDTKPAEAAVAGATPIALHAKLVGDKVEVDEGFDRAWRRVGLALDRVGFTVEDRDRVQGIYFVRYIDPDAVDKKGFFGKLFSFGDSDKAKEAQRYRILVKAPQGGSTSDVTVQSNDGKAEASPTATKILGLLANELK